MMSFKVNVNRLTADSSPNLEPIPVKEKVNTGLSVAQKRHVGNQVQGSPFCGWSACSLFPDVTSWS